MKRWLRILLLVALASVSPAFAKGDRPNIVFILIDDLPYYGLYRYGGKAKPTPSIDALADGGIVFTHCFSRSWCAPSRATLMTGKYRIRKPRERHPFVSTVLQQAGYKTCLAGKWMVSGYQEDPRAHGFDEALLWVNSYAYWKPDFVVFDSGGYLKEFNQAAHAPKIDEWKTPVGPGPGQAVRMEGRYGPDIVNRFVLDFIRRHKGNPFFVYYAMKLIHVPIMKTPDSKVDPKDVQWDTYSWEMHRYMDKLVGKVTAELDRLGIRDNTMIVFSSDNGGRWKKRQPREGFTHLPGGKGETLEGSLRVPLIVNWPAGAKAGGTCADLVDFVDFLPTFADAAGAPLPEGEIFDGRSFLPQIRGREGTPREWVFNGESDKKMHVRSHTHKLYRDGRFYALTDLEEKSDIKPGKGKPSQETERGTLQKVLDKYAGEASKDEPFR